MSDATTAKIDPATILKIIEAALMFSKLLPQLFEALRQTGELSPQQEQDLDDLIASLKNKPHWKVEESPK